MHNKLKNMFSSHFRPKKKKINKNVLHKKVVYSKDHKDFLFNPNSHTIIQKYVFFFTMMIYNLNCTYIKYKIILNDVYVQC